VYYEIWSDRLRVIGEDSRATEEVNTTLKRLIEEQGLRARLQPVSMVTGQYMINLDFKPDSPVNYVDTEGKVLEIPAVEATRDRMESMLEGLKLDDSVKEAIDALDAIEQLAQAKGVRSLITNANEAVAEVKQLIATIDAGINPVFGRVDNTLADYSELAKVTQARLATLSNSIERVSADISKLSRNIDQKVGPVSNSAVSAFNQAKGAFKSVDGFVGEGSAPRYDLELLLKEASGAARSLRILADYLEQNPDAILKGKYR
jgi:paraquat-inducible protein B